MSVDYNGFLAVAVCSIGGGLFVLRQAKLRHQRLLKKKGESQPEVEWGSRGGVGWRAA